MGTLLSQHSLQFVRIVFQYVTNNCQQCWSLLGPFAEFKKRDHWGSTTDFSILKQYIQPTKPNLFLQVWPKDKKFLRQKFFFENSFSAPTFSLINASPLYLLILSPPPPSFNNVTRYWKIRFLQKNRNIVNITWRFGYADESLPRSL